MFKKIIILGSCLGIGLTLAACGNSSNNKNLTIVGSTALQPLVEKASNNYKKSSANITVQGGGSGTGLSQVQQGSVDIGNSDIFANEQSGVKKNKLVDHQVAVVGIGPVVNKDVTVKNITMSQLKDIFTGKITNWKQVGGKDEKIVIINRAKGSGVRKTFERVALNGEDATNAQEQDSNGTVQKMVGTTPGAISYLAFSYFNDQAKPLKVDNVQANDDNVKNNNWKIWAYEHMYTLKSKNNTVANKFIKYVQSNNDVQNNIVPKMGYISIKDMQVKLDDNGQVTPK